MTFKTKKFTYIKHWMLNFDIVDPKTQQTVQTNWIPHVSVLISNS